MSDRFTSALSSQAEMFRDSLKAQGSPHSG
jgi:hypothetical protein